MQRVAGAVTGTVRLAALCSVASRRHLRTVIYNSEIINSEVSHEHGCRS